MEISRSPDTGLHQIVTERDRARAKAALDNLQASNKRMEAFISESQKNWRERKSQIVVSGVVCVVGLVGLGLSLFKKSEPRH
jgi:hypothetical protein